MKVVYEADIKLKIVMENNDENILPESVPTKERVDNYIREIIENEMGLDTTCEIDIDSKYELS